MAGTNERSSFDSRCAVHYPKLSIMACHKRAYGDPTSQFQPRPHNICLNDNCVHRSPKRQNIARDLRDSLALGHTSFQSHLRARPSGFVSQGYLAPSLSSRLLALTVIEQCGPARNPLSAPLQNRTLTLKPVPNWMNPMLDGHGSAVSPLMADSSQSSTSFFKSDFDSEVYSTSSTNYAISGTEMGFGDFLDPSASPVSLKELGYTQPCSESDYSLLSTESPWEDLLPSVVNEDIPTACKYWKPMHRLSL